MDPEKLCNLTEESVEGIGRVWYIDSGIFLKGEQIRKVRPKTVIRGPDLLVRVIEMLPVLIEGLLGRKVLPFHEPLIEELSEIVFTYERECSSDRQKFLPCFEFRFQSEIPSQYRLLMKVAHLDRDIGKDLSHALSAVENHSVDGEALCFQLRPCIPIHRWAFSLYEPEEDVSFQIRRAEDEDTVPSHEERDVGDEDEELRRDGIMIRYGLVEPFPDSLDIESERPCQLRKRLLAPDVFLPKIRMPALRLFRALKLFPAAYALIPLSPSPFPVLFCFGRTCRTAFFCASYSMVLS